MKSGRFLGVVIFIRVGPEVRLLKRNSWGSVIVKIIHQLRPRPMRSVVDYAVTATCGPEQM